MRNGIVIAAAALVAAGGCSQGHAESGPSVQRQYQVGGFDRIAVAGPYDVKIVTGRSPAVSARGPQALIDRLVVEVRNGELMIHPRKERSFNWSSNQGSAVVEVSAQMIRGLALAGAGDVAIDRVAGDRFESSIAGAGDLTIGSVAVQSLDVTIGGAGDVTAKSGQARTASYSIAGSGEIDAAGVKATAAKISIAGSGNIRGHVSGAADVSIVGSGDVALSGGAKCSVSKMGSGDVRCS